MRVGIHVPVGRLPAESRIADLADTYSAGEVRLTVEQNIILPNVDEAAVAALLKEPALNGDCACRSIRTSSATRCVHGSQSAASRSSRRRRTPTRSRSSGREAERRQAAAHPLDGVPQLVRPGAVRRHRPQGRAGEGGDRQDEGGPWLQYFRRRHDRRGRPLKATSASRRTQRASRSTRSTCSPRSRRSSSRSLAARRRASSRRSSRSSPRREAGARRESVTLPPSECASRVLPLSAPLTRLLRRWLITVSVTQNLMPDMDYTRPRPTAQPPPLPPKYLRWSR